MRAFTLLGLHSLTRLAVAAEAGPIVKHEGVTYQGTTSNSIDHFLNIRYGHPATGALRFAAPKPFTYPDGSTVDVTTRGPACPQLKAGMPPFFSPEDEISEDCLSLRISRPSGLNLSPESKLPVVVWVHGGGVVTGSAYDEHFDPDRLLQLSVKDGKPIIYVAINYRLSIFGFARLPSLKEEKSLNVGMRDQRLAFQWVKDNIAAFGGDPERITAYGLSAGGTFISLHTVAYAGKKGVPFTQAWVMSGPPGTALNMSSEVTEQHTLAVADRVGCGAEGDDGKILECLREVDMQTLLDEAMAYSVENHPPAGLFTFITSIDGDIIPERQSELYRSGRFVKDIPFILGYTQDDGAFNAGPAHLLDSTSSMAATIKSFASAISDSQLTQLFSLYPSSDFLEPAALYDAHKSPSDPEVPIHWFRLSQIVRDMLFTCSNIEFGYQMAKHSKRFSKDGSGAGVRLYALNQSMLTPMWKGAGMPYVGVSHGSDSNYIFNGVFPEGEVSNEDEELSVSMSRDLIRFAYTGDPSGEEGAKWGKAFDVSKGANEDEFVPVQANIRVIGGPYGSGDEMLIDTTRMKEAWGGGSEQQAVIGEEMGAMRSPGEMERKRRLEDEKLFERCKFFSSIAETLGV